MCYESIRWEESIRSQVAWTPYHGSLIPYLSQQALQKIEVRGSKIPQNKQIFTVGSPTVVELLNHQQITSPTWSSELWNDTFHLPFQGTEYLCLNWWGATTSGHLCSDIPRHTRVERPEFQGAGGHNWHWSFFWKRWWHLENMIWWNVVDVQDWIVVSNWLRFRSDDFETIRLCRMNTYSFNRRRSSTTHTQGWCLPLWHW